MNRGCWVGPEDTGGYETGIGIPEVNGPDTAGEFVGTTVADGILGRRTSRYGLDEQLELRKSKKLKRLVEKNGVCNVLHCNVPRRGDFLRDGFTTLLDLQWRWVLVIFSFVYVIGWSIFAGFWFALAWDHGDLDYRVKDPEWEPCVVNVDNFVSAFLYSVETQTTIGYGSRSVTEACWMAGLLVVIQSVFSCLVNAVMIGCIFAKLARPKKRAATIKFSKNACIAERDGHLCLMFRVGDVRESHIYDARIRAQLVRPHVTEEGECIPIANFKLTLENSSLEEQIFLVWPIIISHVIDEESPLYNVSASTLKTSPFEVIVILEGVLEQTGLIMQARTSYLPSEILWGHRFSSQLTMPHEDQEHLVVDYKQFNAVYPVQNALEYSAKERDLVEQQGLDVHAMNPHSLRSVLKKSYSFEKRQRMKHMHTGADSPRFTNGRGSITFLDEVEEFVSSTSDEDEEDDDGMVFCNTEDEHNKDVGFSESVEEATEGEFVEVDTEGSVV